MPRKLRELRAELRRGGWYILRQVGSHETWVNDRMPDERVILSGRDGADAQRYQERDVADATKALLREGESE